MTRIEVEQEIHDEHSDHSDQSDDEQVTEAVEEPVKEPIANETVINIESKPVKKLTKSERSALIEQFEHRPANLDIFCHSFHNMYHLDLYVFDIPNAY